MSERNPQPSRAGEAERDGRGSPQSVTAYTVALGAAGIAGALAATATFGWPDRVSWGAVGPFLVLLAAAAHLILRFQYRDQVMALDLTEAVLAGAIVAFPSAIVVGITAVALLAVESAHRNSPTKVAFNVAQWMSAAATGTLVFGLLRHDPSILDGRTVLALVAAMAAVAVVNTLAFAFVIKLAEGQSARGVLTSLAPSILLGWTVNTAFGLLLVAAYQWSVLAVGLFFVLLVVLHGAYRGYATAAADRARLHGMHRATRELTAPIDPTEAIPRFLAEVREAFQAEAADLVLLQDGGGRIVHRAAAAEPWYSLSVEMADAETLASVLMRYGEPVRITAANTDLSAGRRLRREGWRDCLATPLQSDNQTIGLLCIYNRSGLEGFEEGERAVLEALAHEAADAIQKGTLFERILEERRTLAEIVDNASDGIMTFAPDGTILTWNPGIERITGYRADEIIGSHLFAALRPRDAEGADVTIVPEEHPGAGFPQEIQITARSGDVRWLSCSYTLVPDPEGRPGCLIVVARDATQVHRIEQIKDDFIATVSHELRTPLTPIKGWAVTLIESGGRLSEEHRRDAARSILRQAESLERIIVDLLEVARIEQGAAEHADAIVDVKEVVHRVAAECRIANPARVVRVEAGAGLCRARGDDLWIERVLSNLLSNAVKYAPPEEPIDVRLRETVGWVDIQVIDHGPGIPAHESERIFERFQRLGDHMTRSVGGTGLGLYISRQLAHAIGGEVTVEPTPGGGATFTLRLHAAGGLVAVAESQSAAS